MPKAWVCALLAIAEPPSSSRTTSSQAPIVTPATSPAPAPGVGAVAGSPAEDRRDGAAEGEQADDADRDELPQVGVEDVEGRPGRAGRGDREDGGGRQDGDVGHPDAEGRHDEDDDRDDQRPSSRPSPARTRARRRPARARRRCGRRRRRGWRPRTGSWSKSSGARARPVTSPAAVSSEAPAGWWATACAERFFAGSSAASSRVLRRPGCSAGRCSAWRLPSAPRGGGSSGCGGLGGLVVVRRCPGPSSGSGLPVLGAAWRPVRVARRGVVVGRVRRLPVGGRRVGGAVGVVALGVPAALLVARIRFGRGHRSRP